MKQRYEKISLYLDIILKYLIRRNRTQDPKYDRGFILQGATLILHSQAQAIDD